ncbi:MAG: 54S ribosomal protein, mitochondrial [Chaenotheca gracillima]|nr:MAG: 54S ribosomal protein, mitochondrial [Chaenotheca gracillima]
MSLGRQAPKRLTRCLQYLRAPQYYARQLDGIRSFSSTTSVLEGDLKSTSEKPTSEPTILPTSSDGKDARPPAEKLVGSRRRRVALKSSANIPFEQLPYQCFQEARKVLQADREEKLQQISSEREKIRRLEEKVATDPKEEFSRQTRLKAMRKFLEDLKILADINDPAIKKRFEDGQGDMNRPIYRYLADREWRSYRRRLLVQRITQMSIVPDVLPHFDPTAEVRLAFLNRVVHPGDFVDSRVSEVPPRLRVHLFDKGERLFSLVVIDSDVPDLERDQFDYRCHFLAANIPISPSTTSVPLSRLADDTQIILPWLPPYAQKGSPYHRLSVFLVEQPEAKVLDAQSTKEHVKREGFNLRSFLDKHSLKPIGAHLFRNKWDEGTAEVMGRLGIDGADTEFRRRRLEPVHKMPLPLKKKKNRPGLASKRL